MKIKGKFISQFCVTYKEGADIVLGRYKLWRGNHYIVQSHECVLYSFI